MNECGFFNSSPIGSWKISTRYTCYQDFIIYVCKNQIEQKCTIFKSYTMLPLDNAPFFPYRAITVTTPLAILLQQ